MFCDDKMIKNLRSLLADNDESMQIFTDDEIKEVAENAKTKNHSLYILFTQKAGKIVNSETSIKSIKAGNEEVTRLNAEELSRLALKQAEAYRQLWNEEQDEKALFLYSS